MGDVYLALCPCGYQADDLLVGSGMAGPESDCELGRCEHCRQIVSVNSNDVRHRCPSCGQKVALIDRRHLGEVPQVCPKCAAPSLALQHVGLWD